MIKSARQQPGTRHLWRLRTLFAGSALLSASVMANAVTAPALPKLFDAAYAAPAGHTISVTAGGDLQAALNQAQLGDTIVLQAGAHFAGPFTLPSLPRTASTSPARPPWPPVSLISNYNLYNATDIRLNKEKIGAITDA